MRYRNSFLGTWVLSKVKQHNGKEHASRDIKIRFDPDGTYEIKLKIYTGECTFSGTYQVLGNQIKRLAQGSIEVDSFTYNESRDMLTALSGITFTHVA